MDEESPGILYNIIGSASINICSAQGIRVRFKKREVGVRMYILELKDIYFTGRNEMWNIYSDAQFLLWN